MSTNGHQLSRNDLGRDLTGDERRRLGRALKSLRILRDETQGDVADALALSPKTVQVMETAGHDVRPDSLEKVLEYYDVTVCSLLGDAASAGRLTDEDLRVARQFHDANTTVRNRMLALLNDELDAPNERRIILASWERYLEYLSPAELKGIETQLQVMDKLARAAKRDSSA